MRIWSTVTMVIFVSLIWVNNYCRMQLTEIYASTGKTYILKGPWLASSNWKIELLRFLSQPAHRELNSIALKLCNFSKNTKKHVCKRELYKYCQKCRTDIIFLLYNMDTLSSWERYIRAIIYYDSNFVTRLNPPFGNPRVTTTANATRTAESAVNYVYIILIRMFVHGVRVRIVNWIRKLGITNLLLLPPPPAS